MNCIGKDLKSVSQRELEAIAKKKKVHDEYVAALRAALQALDDEGRKLDEERNAALPFSKLPLEVKTEIFVLACNSADRVSPSEWDDTPPPFIIGSVCRSWRNIAWSIPELWTNLTLVLSASRPASQNDLIQQWLERTGKRRLHINIKENTKPKPAGLDNDSDTDDDDDDDPSEPPIDIFRILLKTCHRWENLQLVTFDNFFEAMAEASNPSFDSLKSIVLNAKKVQDEPPDWTLKLGPSLNKLVLGPGFAKRHLELSWGNLRELDVTLPFENCLEILKQGEMLISCALSVAVSQNVPVLTSPLEEIVLPHLTRLSLCGQDSPLAVLMPVLKTPQLTSLQLRVLGNTSILPLWMTVFPTMTSQNPFPLTSLSIHVDQDRFGEDEILALLQKLHNIEHLELSFRRSFILSRLTLDELLLPPEMHEDPQQNDYLKRLRSFQYTGCVRLDTEDLLDVLKFRLASSDLQVHGNASSESTSQSSLIFSMSIQYTNRYWLTEKDPNDLQKFYKNLAALSPAVELSIAFTKH